MRKVLIYYTDNTLPKEIQDVQWYWLKKEAGDIPIISVSQKPIDLGTNICVGLIGRSWLSLYKQIFTGIEATDADYVGMVEHDCIYSAEHLNWTPPTDDAFYYNHNNWLVRWSDGMYSYYPKRYALSQMVCNRELLKKSLTERLALLEQGFVMAKGLAGAGEFGVKDSIALVRKIASSGSSDYLPVPNGWLTEYRSEVFSTNDCNLDIRYGGNFTGNKRGKKRRYEIPYWGRFESVKA